MQFAFHQFSPVCHSLRFTNLAISKVHFSDKIVYVCWKEERLRPLLTEHQVEMLVEYRAMILIYCLSLCSIQTLHNEVHQGRSSKHSHCEIISELTPCKDSHMALRLCLPEVHTHYSMYCHNGLYVYLFITFPSKNPSPKQTMCGKIKQSNVHTVLLQRTYASEHIP